MAPANSNEGPADPIEAVIVDDGFVVRGGGRQVGPLSRVQLDLAVEAGHVTADDEIWCNGRYMCRGQQMYGQLRFPALPRPLRFLLFGPDQPPYRGQEADSAGRRKRWLTLVAAAVAPLILLVIGQALNPFDMSMFGIVIWFVGLLALSGGICEWSWFFNNRNARGLRRWLGDRGARQFYVGFGLAMLLLSGMVFAKAALWGAVGFALSRPLTREEIERTRARRVDKPSSWMVGDRRVRELRLPKQENYDQVAVSSGGEYVLLCGRERSLFRWTPSTGDFERLWERGKTEFDSRSLCVRSADGRVLAVVRCLIQHPDRRLEFHVYHLDETLRAAPVKSVSDEAGSADARGQIELCAISGDGGRILVVDSRRIAEVWDVNSGRVVALIPMQENATAAALSGDGRLLLICDGRGGVRLYNADAGSLLDELSGGDPAQCVVFDPTGPFAATARERRHRSEVAIWDVSAETLQLRHSFARTNSRVRLVFSPTGKQLAIGGSDDIILLVDVQSGREVHSLVGRSGTAGLAYSADGRYLAAAARSKVYRIWELPAPASSASEDGAAQTSR